MMFFFVLFLNPYREDANQTIQLAIVVHVTPASHSIPVRWFKNKRTLFVYHFTHPSLNDFYVYECIQKRRIDRQPNGWTDGRIDRHTGHNTSSVHWVTGAVNWYNSSFVLWFVFV